MDHRDRMWSIHPDVPRGSSSVDVGVLPSRGRALYVSLPAIPSRVTKIDPNRPLRFRIYESDDLIS
jgi:hypothetical protein